MRNRYNRYQATIEHLIDDGSPPEAVEQTIESFPLPQDEKDALTLWAWAWTESAQRL